LINRITSTRKKIASPTTNLIIFIHHRQLKERKKGRKEGRTEGSKEARKQGRKEEKERKTKHNADKGQYSKQQIH
jgi:hypothetical protein